MTHPLHPLHSLLHLVTISIAICMAYVALERFRYANKAKEVSCKALDMLINKLSEVDRKRDTSLTMIRKKINEIEKGMGPKLLLGHGCKLFGSSTKYGLDLYIMGALILIQYIILLYITIYHGFDGGRAFWIILIFNCTTAIIPLLLIYGGKQQLNKHNEEIIILIHDVAEEYQLKIDEDEIKRLIHGGPEEYQLKINKLQQKIQN